MIFDSTIWVDYLRGKKSAKTDLLDQFLAEYDPVNVHLCPPVFQEILQGLNKEDNPVLIKDLLITCQFLNLDGFFCAEQSAILYRQLRDKGVTIRKPNDCLIAFYAIHFKLELVHNDKDFEKIAKYTPLKTYST
ncbi:MAG: PIN domain nuclease [Bacteroidetes bacterium CHB5]|nr:PIN domain nuclease [Bacteroidetes bacterium CHB5]